MKNNNSSRDRRGPSTSEFWLSLSAVVVGAVISSGLLAAVPVAVKVAGIVTVVLASMGYTASRTMVKRDS